MRTRFSHLQALEEPSDLTQTSTEYSRWANIRLNRWLVDWCLRMGNVQTARALAESNDLSMLVDLSLFADINRIEKALTEHRCTEALAWCSDNKSFLRKAKNSLEFELRLQEYIELCRGGQHTEAIGYAKKHLVQWQEVYLDKIKQASSLLAFPPTTPCPPYKVSIYSAQYSVY